MGDRLTETLAQVLRECSGSNSLHADAEFIAVELAARLRAAGLVLEEGNVLVCSSCRSPLCFAGEFPCEVAREAGVSTALAVPASQILAEGPSEAAAVVQDEQEGP